MIVMKFGGSSVADAERILAVVEIVRARLERRPVIVVSALGGVTDLLDRAGRAAERDERETLEPALAELERLHRWATAGSVSDPGRRHRLDLELGGVFEELREQLRSIRILGERTERSRAAVLAFGECMSGRLLAAALADHGVPARWIDPRTVMITDDDYGAARPDMEQVRARCDSILQPVLDSGEVPVVGGFVGSSPTGETTTLGRGGSDTSASIIGCAMPAEEIQIWTDVDGLLTADPRLVSGARRLPQVSFAEAAELAFYGAKVLHPASIAPAVSRQIPVRVLNSMRPEGAGTVVLDEIDDAPGIASVASRPGVRLVRFTRRRLGADPTFLTGVLEACRRQKLAPDLLVSSEVGVSLATAREPDRNGLLDGIGPGVELTVMEERAIVCVVGRGLALEGPWRAQVMTALGAAGAELVALGATGTSAAAVVRGASLQATVRGLHEQFFGREGVAQ